MCNLFMQVPYASFVPSHLVSTFTIARPSAMVVDIGHRETTVLPVSLRTAVHMICVHLHTVVCVVVTCEERIVCLRSTQVLIRPWPL